MCKKKYYLDTCIWLNLFKKEGDASKGKPYWKIAEEFIKKKEQLITFSPLVLKELEYKINNKTKFKEIFKFLKDNFTFIKISIKDYEIGRKLESKFNYEISFYDCLHIALCKRLNLILITRDKELINYSRKHILVKKPEELI